MAVDWQNDIRKTFGNAIHQANHTLHKSPAFCDASLAALLDAYPRDQLGIWTFAKHGEGDEAPIRGVAPDLSGEELLAAVRDGRIWLNLRATNQRVENYAAIGEQIFDTLQDAGGHKVFKRDMGVLISSPGVNVHYHLDIPMVALLQIRGEKTVWIYPASEQFAPSEKVESIALRQQEEGLPFRNEFESEAVEIQLKPGMALTWPQAAPHRVQNGSMLNVSLSCEFMTVPALLRANAFYANGRLRRDFGARPERPDKLGAQVFGKALFARLLKTTEKKQVKKAPTAPSFVVDLSAENCTRPIKEPAL
ncbi:hypothetical protein [Henriciella sp.]|uniref:hypothetical protein n=1 Tax=Henriciella sp. TaxID=1968823 RepID=UPI002633777A|nr:hypothetical protein [Henriciella sp.]